jgi:hypothetical protein
MVVPGPAEAGPEGVGFLAERDQPPTRVPFSDQFERRLTESLATQRVRDLEKVDLEHMFPQGWDAGVVIVGDLLIELDTGNFDVAGDNGPQRVPAS